LFKVYKALKKQVLKKIEHLRRSTTQWHKSIHLTLEVKTFFSNFTPTTGFSTEPSTQSLDFALMVINGITGREERSNLHTTVIKQSLSNYTKQG
jgi:hypothetical protein